MMIRIGQKKCQPSLAILSNGSVSVLSRCTKLSMASVFCRDCATAGRGESRWSPRAIDFSTVNEIPEISGRNRSLVATFSPTAAVVRAPAPTHKSET
ncbi:hypothetical protein EVAR_44405_1 [Eumeta japonica]|uniref:Uncharacterized protein n=1 Tax=Eumeta variegata TaxID=151549 RepID=A0A4C1XRH2_EUMVA|nr:hypothetical protein EVAR_44405_1 [Eumeta japonica]